MPPDEENEQLYNVRTAIPEHLQIFARWAADSEKVRGQLNDRAELDLAYGPHQRQKLDLFHADDPQAPLYVFLHGGYWQAMDKSFSSFIAPAYLRAGCALAVINYRLCPDVRLVDIVEDAAQAVVWLSQNRGSLGMKDSGMYLVGHSAGGHLVAMLLTRADTAPLIAGITAISGLFDLRPLVGTSINEKLGLDEAEALALSPAFMRPLAEVPLNLFAGELESAAFHQQRELLAANWAPYLGCTTSRAVPACHHLSIIDQLPLLTG